MHFSTKSYLKSTRNHTAKQALNPRATNYSGALHDGQVNAPGLPSLIMPD
jgi:hypothetical protein